MQNLSNNINVDIAQLRSQATSDAKCILIPVAKPQIWCGLQVILKTKTRANFLIPFILLSFKLK